MKTRKTRCTEFAKERDPHNLLEKYLKQATELNPSRGMILTTNKKVVKNTKRGYLTGAIHLSPADESVPYGGVNMCAMASEGCRGGCLKGSGCHHLPYQQVRRIALTLWYLKHKTSFMERLDKEILALVRKAEKKGLECAIRPNALSDQRDLALALAEKYPNIMIFDYSKLPGCEGAFRPNYHITFSLAENNEAEAMRVLACGVNVAVVFTINKGEELPKTFWGRPVLDGDIDDMRWAHPKQPDGIGSVVGLRLKGINKFKDHAIKTGFAVKPGYEPLVVAA